MNTNDQWNKQWFAMHVKIRCGSMSNTAPVSLLANEIDLRSVSHRQVSLTAVNHIYVFHVGMNSCKNLKIYEKVNMIRNTTITHCIMRKSHRTFIENNTSERQ